MEFKYIQKKDNVNNFHLYQDDFVLWCNNKLYKNGELLFEKEINHAFYYKNTYLIITNDFQESLLINPLNKLEILNKNVNGLDAFFDETTILFSDWNNDFTKLYKIKIDLFENKVIWNVESYFGNSIIFKNEFYGSNEKLIFRIDSNSAQPLWQYDLANLGQYKPIGGYEHEMNSYQVAKFLGIWQNEVLVACEGGLILALSTTDGTLKRKWDKLPENSDKSMSDVFKGQLHQSGNVFQLNIANDKIFGLYFHHLVTIDLKSGEIQITALTNTFNEHFISAFQTKSGYSEDETHYYTTVMLDQQKLELNYMPTAVCALSKKTYKIDWLYRFDQDSKGNFVSIQIPQVANNKLYQLTANNVIYIFEREN